MFSLVLFYLLSLWFKVPLGFLVLCGQVSSRSPAAWDLCNESINQLSNKDVFSATKPSQNAEQRMEGSVSSGDRIALGTNRGTRRKPRGIPVRSLGYAGLFAIS